MEDISRLKYIKSVYGLKAFENNEATQYGNETIIGWYMCGYETIDDLVSAFGENKIESLYEQGND